MKLQRLIVVGVGVLATLSAAFAQNYEDDLARKTELNGGEPGFSATEAAAEAKKFLEGLERDSGVTFGNSLAGAPTSLNAAGVGVPRYDGRNAAESRNAITRFSPAAGNSFAGIGGPEGAGPDWAAMFTSAADAVSAGLITILPLAIGLMILFVLARLVWRWVKKAAH